MTRSTLALVFPDRDAQLRLEDEASGFVNPPRLVEVPKPYVPACVYSFDRLIPTDLGDYPVEDRWSRVTYGPDG